MKSYSKLIPSDLFTTNSVGVTTLSRPNGYYDYLTCPLSNKGNFVNPTAWNYTAHQEQFTHGTHRLFGLPGSGWNGLVTTYKGNLASPCPLPPWDNRDAMYNLALSRLNDKVRGGLDLSIALAESGTTAKMLRSTAKLLSHARRFKPLSGYGGPKDVANGYLQFKYGWKPLMGDVFAACDEGIRLTMNALENSLSAGAKVRKGGTSVVYYNYVNGLVPNVPFERTVTGDSRQACRIGVCLSIPSSAFRLDRWTSMNPLSIAWELTPYSFVVDWFYDVGSYLRNLETALLYNAVFKYGWVSELHREEFTDYCGLYNHIAFNFRNELTDIRAECRHVVFARRVLASYPFPRKPTLKVDLSSGQLMSAASLLAQLMPGHKRVPAGPPSQYRKGGI